MKSYENNKKVEIAPLYSSQEKLDKPTTHLRMIENTEIYLDGEDYIDDNYIYINECKRV